MNRWVPVFALLAVMGGGAAAQEALFKIVLTNGNQMYADQVWIDGGRVHFGRRGDRASRPVSDVKEITTPETSDLCYWGTEAANRNSGATRKAAAARRTCAQSRLETSQQTLNQQLEEAKRRERSVR